MKYAPTKVVIWKKARAPNPRRALDRLTESERENVLRALGVLRQRLGGWMHVAAALRTNKQTVNRRRSGRCRMTATFALRIARVLGIPLGDVISGRFPAPAACPRCGNSGYQ